MLPSELDEEDVIQIRSPEGVIEFHRYYGELRMAAKNTNTNPGDCRGIAIKATETQCDDVYKDWAMACHNRDTGTMPAAAAGVEIVEIMATKVKTDWH